MIVRATRLPDHVERAHRSSARSILREGYEVMFDDRLLRGITLLGMAWAAASAGAWALAVPLFREVIGLTSTQTGVALAVGAAMGVVAPPVVGRLEARIGGLAIILVGIPLTSVTIAAIGVADAFWMAALAYAVFQFVDYVSVAAYIGERLRRAPLRLQSTVGIVGRMLIMLSFAVGSAAASGLTELISLRAVYAGMAVLTLAVGAVGIAAFWSARRSLVDGAVSERA